MTKNPSDTRDYACQLLPRLQLESSLPAPDFAKAYCGALRTQAFPAAFLCLSDDDSDDSEVFGPSDGLRLLNDERGSTLMTYLTPKMACKLFVHGSNLSRRAKAEGPGVCLPHLPPVAHPCARDDQWWDSFLQCLQRILARISLGRAPNVNCNGEVIALCLLLNYCKAADASNRQDTHLQSKLQYLPSHRLDSDFDLLKDVALSDYDILLCDEADNAGSFPYRSRKSEGNSPMSRRSLSSGSDDDALSKCETPRGNAEKRPPNHWFMSFDPECMYDHVR